MDEASEANLERESLKALAANIVIQLFGFAGIFLFARLVDKSSLGGYYLLFALVQLANRPNLGLCRGTRKRWSETDSPKAELLGATLLINLVWAVTLGIVIYGFRAQIDRYIGVNGSSVLFVALVSSFLLYYPFQQVISAMGYAGKQRWTEAIRSILSLPTQVILIIIGFGALGIGYGLVAATVISTPIATYIVSTKPALPKRTTLNSLWDFAKYSIPNAIVGKGYDKMDILLLGFLVNSAAVANYEVALRLTIPAIFVSGALSTTLMPKISNTLSKGGDFSHDIEKSSSYSSIISIPIFFGSVALATPIVTSIFGDQYATAAPYLIGLSLYQVISTQTTIYRASLDGIDLPNLGLKANISALGLNIILGFGLIFLVGPIGVVIATIIAEFIQYVISMYPIYKRYDVGVFPELLKKEIISGVIMVVPLFIIPSFLEVNNLISTLSIILLGAIIYFCSLLLLDQDLRKTTLSFIKDNILIRLSIN